MAIKGKKQGIKKKATKNPTIKSTKTKMPEIGETVYITGQSGYTGNGVVIGVRADNREIQCKLPDGKTWYVDAVNFKRINTGSSSAIASEGLDTAKLDSLVIAAEVREEIVAVLKQHKNHKKLFEEWGLGDVIEYGKGMTFMFYGSPGTGKTWGANCIAKALGTTLLTVSAAEIQSSEPGGANRSIQQAFATIKSTGQVLFLDECDSLIANRAELGMVLASEVNTLLTEIEKTEGVVILATNRIEHMDEALERRISLIVEFPKPDFANRKLIWSKLLPKKMPLHKDVDHEDLAAIELTGGQIKNVILQAARLAVSNEAKEVSRAHFDSAIRRVNVSKNLMGTASRYIQVPTRADTVRSTGTSKDIVRTKIKAEETND